MNPEIEAYINKRYSRWLDYSQYHCTQAGMTDESVDVLNEVLLSLLQKPEDQLLKLLEARKNQYTELDFYILRMIKFNATSDTAPYRSKYKPMPVDKNVDFALLDIEDIKADEPDKSSEYLEKYRDVCRIVERMDLNRSEKDCFEIAFVLGEPVSYFYNNNTIQKKKAYTDYLSIKMAVTVILFNEGKTKLFPKGKIIGRAKQLIEQYN